MDVEVWADPVCPWCYIGKRRLERALELLARPGEVDVVWRSFQLMPDAPRFGEPGAGEPIERELLDKMGGDRERVREIQRHVTELASQEGLAYRLDEALRSNTFDAHRLVHGAAAEGVDGAVIERLFAAQLVEGRRIDDPATLVAIAAESGMDEQQAGIMLDEDRYAQDVYADISLARQLGVSGVPFFAIDRRYGVSGAQPAEVLAEALRRALDEGEAQPRTRA